jgi:hypothetical protein
MYSMRIRCQAFVQDIAKAGGLINYIKNKKDK